MATWPTFTNDDGSGTTGTLLTSAKLGEIQTYIGGAWATRTFAAGNYYGSASMTVTVDSGDVANEGYVEIGKTMIYGVQLAPFSIGGTPNADMRITIPNGRTAQRSAFVSVAYCNDNGTVREAYAAAVGGTTYITVQLKSGAAWAASTNGTYVYFSIAFEIN